MTKTQKQLEAEALSKMKPCPCPEKCHKRQTCVGACREA